MRTLADVRPAWGARGEGSGASTPHLPHAARTSRRVLAPLGLAFERPPRECCCEIAACREAQGAEVATLHALTCARSPDMSCAARSRGVQPGTGKKSPMELIAEVAPIGVEEDVAVCYGHEDPVLGHPVEFIKVSTATKENPAVCKYCGLRYYQLHH